MATAEETYWPGAVVAVEGPKKLVSTQLQLLPSSSNILILPALETYMPTPASSFLHVFDPVQHLRQVNTAMKRRHRDAQAFLCRGSSNNNTDRGNNSSRRLVFLEGGAASAHALSLKALMQHETAGDRAAAEALLGQLTRHGFAGLARASQEQRSRSAPIYYSVCHHLADDDDGLSDPGARAMRAADALDRQTASLQVSNELDLTRRSLSRASSLPAIRSSMAADSLSGDAAPFLVFGQSSSLSDDDDDDDDDGTPTAARRRSQSPQLRSPRFSIVHYDRDGEMPPVFGFDDCPTAGTFASTVAEADDDATTPGRDSSAAAAAQCHRRFPSSTISPMSDAFSMRSVGNVEYGRASLLDMRSTSVRGGDGGFAPGVKAAVGSASHDGDEPKHSWRPAETRLFGYNSSPPARQSSVGELARKESMTGESIMTYPPTRQPSTAAAGGRPKTIVVKRSRPVIKLQPVPSTKKHRWQQGTSTYIHEDGGGDVPGGGGAQPPTPPQDSDEADYEPIFPRMEDLVLYLRSELTPQPLLESALNAMREEYMRKSACSSSASSSPSTKASTASTTGTFSQADDDSTVALTSPEESCTEQDDEDDQCTPTTAVKMTPPVEALPSMDDYDPFAYINPAYGKTTTAVRASKPPQASVPIQHPPTPAQTPPPEEHEPAKAACADVAAIEQPQQQQQEELPQQQQPDTEKEVIPELDSGIREIAIVPRQPPIEVQNSIRDVLRRHYPVAPRGYTSQFQFPPGSSSAEEDDDGSGGLWRPIFRSSLPAAVGADGHLRPQLKQILAVGLQHGLKREYAARVISQIERFGTEPTGSARCSRLDFRYLLANTMQSFTARPLRSQMAAAAENPFHNPQLLATLMLPHLETYLAVHADVRFLILEYPPEHLPTVVAIQKLAGVDLVKIAQIVDARSQERLPFRHVRDSSVGSGSTSGSGGASGRSLAASSIYSKRSASLYHTPSRPAAAAAAAAAAPDVDRARANFLLTSSASGGDIAEFVAAVWDVPVAERPQSANPAAAITAPPPPPPPTTSNRDAGDKSLPLEPPTASAKPVEDAALPSPRTPEKSPVKQRKPKPAPLHTTLHTLSAFPKTPTTPRTPIPPSPWRAPAATAAANSAPPRPPRPDNTVAPALRTTAATHHFPGSRSPSPQEHEQQPQQSVVARLSAVGASALLPLRKRGSSSSTLRTTNSGGGEPSSRPSTPHIAYLRKTATAPVSGRPATPSRLHNPSLPESPISQQQQHLHQHLQEQYHSHHSRMSMLQPPPPFLDSPSMAGSTLGSEAGGLMDDGASFITLDPVLDCDFDREDLRVMPHFGRKSRRRGPPGTEKALRVLGMMAYEL